MLLITVDSLRFDHYQYMSATQDFLGDSHTAAFATNTATPSCFQSIIGGIYPGEAGVDQQTSFVPDLPHSKRIGISTNRFLTARYGYDSGFDVFSEPSRAGESLKDRVAASMTPKSRLYGVASRLYNFYQGLQGQIRTAEREYRSASGVIDEFLTNFNDTDWFGWLHFMEPHHPYNPSNAPVSRTEAQQITRRLLNGRGSGDDAELGRELYRGEVIELDESLARLWNSVPEETQVLFCADHGELLGEHGEWGHHARMCPELLRVPFATRNIDIPSEVVSIVDIPGHLLGREYGDGNRTRNIAFAASNGRHAVMNADRIATEDRGVRTLSGDPTEDSELEEALAEWQRTASVPVSREELPEDDLKALGYL